MIGVADAGALPFRSASFDLIFTSPPWDDLDVIVRVRSELRRVLTRKGRMVMVLPHLDDPTLATLAVTNRDWTERAQYAIDKPDVNRGWRYRSLPDSLVRDVIQRMWPRRILDPFCGAGTIPRVATRLGIPAFGVDLSLDAARLAVA